eukprot:116972-Amphidinium_carterae.1
MDEIPLTVSQLTRVLESPEEDEIPLDELPIPLSTRILGYAPAERASPANTIRLCEVPVPPEFVPLTQEEVRFLRETFWGVEEGYAHSHSFHMACYMLTNPITGENLGETLHPSIPGCVPRLDER